MLSSKARGNVFVGDKTYWQYGILSLGKQTGFAGTGTLEMAGLIADSLPTLTIYRIHTKAHTKTFMGLGFKGRSRGWLIFTYIL